MVSLASYSSKNMFAVINHQTLKFLAILRVEFVFNYVADGYSGMF